MSVVKTGAVTFILYVGKLRKCVRFFLCCSSDCDKLSTAVQSDCEFMKTGAMKCALHLGRGNELYAHYPNLRSNLGEIRYTRSAHNAAEQLWFSRNRRR
jgi:hypothetical protein